MIVNKKYIYTKDSDLSCFVVHHLTFISFDELTNIRKNNNKQTDIKDPLIHNIQMCKVIWNFGIYYHCSQTFSSAQYFDFRNKTLLNILSHKKDGEDYEPTLQRLNYFDLIVIIKPT